MGARGPVEVRVVWVPGAQWRLGWVPGARGPVEVGRGVCGRSGALAVASAAGSPGRAGV